MKTILIVDDEPNLRMLVGMTLESPGYRILQAPDAAAAMQLLTTEPIDLVLLDWMMPGGSGIELAKAVRAAPATSRVPIVMLTAKSQERDRAVADGLDLHGYLVKPFSPLELIQCVRATLGPS